MSILDDDYVEQIGKELPILDFCINFVLNPVYVWNGSFFRLINTVDAKSEETQHVSVKDFYKIENRQVTSFHGNCPVLSFINLYIIDNTAPNPNFLTIGEFFDSYFNRPKAIYPTLARVEASEGYSKHYGYRKFKKLLDSYDKGRYVCQKLLSKSNYTNKPIDIHYEYIG